MRLAWFILPLGATLVGASFAQRSGDGKAELLEYRNSTQFAVWTCRKNVETALSIRERGGDAGPYGDWSRCISAQGKSATSKLQRALETVRKPSATAAVNVYHGVAMSALQGVVPLENESATAYAARQETARGQMEKAWLALENEHGEGKIAVAKRDCSFANPPPEQTVLSVALDCATTSHNVRVLEGGKPFYVSESSTKEGPTWCLVPRAAVTGEIMVAKERKYLYCRK